MEVADRIEGELKRLGLWSRRLSAETSPQAAFGADSLSFEEWLQAVLLPSLREAAVHGNLPTSSNLAIAGIRNLDGVPDVERLLSLLAKVDALAESTTDR
jgi:uncharacterized protein YqcC (DUF446 family)